MRIIFFILTFFICATGVGQSDAQKLIITPLTKDFYIYTTFDDPGNGSMFPAKGTYLVQS